ncbi:hypothetical protein A0H81_02487 [Grifola frondosa]|uniref:Uncharacterized protein n=1 Tax=Grifola frondosa TaxID=5627 RepID=A0A1C7MP49_GRIFR|nr:hypothetical protein A0H81_02487 [Grifola frondosa]
MRAKLLSNLQALQRRNSNPVAATFSPVCRRLWSCFRQPDYQGSEGRCREGKVKKEQKKSRVQHTDVRNTSSEAI